MSFHLFEDDPTSLQVHVSPESVDVQIDESEEVAASLVPSLEEVMPPQYCEVARETQVAPEFVDVEIFPPKTVAASLVPSLEEVMPPQICEVAREVQVAPESVEVQMFPPRTVAASFVPSFDIVTRPHRCVLSVGFTSVHVDALTEASEANESNTASRTRSIVFGSTGIVSLFFKQY